MDTSCVFATFSGLFLLLILSHSLGGGRGRLEGEIPLWPNLNPACGNMLRSVARGKRDVLMAAHASLKRLIPLPAVQVDEVGTEVMEPR